MISSIRMFIVKKLLRLACFVDIDDHSYSNFYGTCFQCGKLESDK